MGNAADVSGTSREATVNELMCFDRTRGRTISSVVEHRTDDLPADPGTSPSVIGTIDCQANRGLVAIRGGRNRALSAKITLEERYRPFRAYVLRKFVSPGRCPGLVCCTLRGIRFMQLAIAPDGPQKLGATSDVKPKT